MKKIGFLFGMVLAIVFVSGNGFVSQASSPSIINLHVVFSSKAYWDGPSQSCIPREKGGCCHIWLDNLPGPGQIIGELSAQDSKLLTLTISRSKGVDRATFEEVFSRGNFSMNGDVTFSPEVLKKLSLPPYYSIPAGEYRVTISGDIITVYFK
jgi:hypothetical protein